MDAARLDALITYCRLDADALSESETVLLEGMLNDAEAYMMQAGIRVPNSDTARRAQYDQLVNAMVLDAWENRGSQVYGIGGAQLSDNPAFRRKITQLKLTEPVPESGTKS